MSDGLLLFTAMVSMRVLISMKLLSIVLHGAPQMPRLENTRGTYVCVSLSAMSMKL